MKVLYMALAVALLPVAQSVDGPTTGSWTANFEGRTFIKLELRAVNGGLAGSLSLGDIEVDPRGMVKRADAAPSRLTPIFAVIRKGPIVTFSMKEGNDTDQFELRLLGDAEAELHFLLNEEDRKDIAASGVPPPRPIRLTKAG
jgi:hypothetical protein